MNRKFNVLFINKSYCVPTSPNGIQFRKFISALSSKNINPTIVAKRTGNFQVNQSNIDLIYVPEIKHKLFKSVLRRIFPDIIYLPDIERLTFYPQIKNTINKTLGQNKTKYDWIHSVSFPCSNHLIGLHLKRKLNIPWVAHFYDPWIGNPYRKHFFNFSKRYDTKLERLVAENADIIFHTNQIIIDDWIDRYGDLVVNKIHLLPFNYSDEDIKRAEGLNKSNNENEKKILLHVGNLYLQRNLDDLIASMCLVKEIIPNLNEKISIQLVGVVSKRDILNIEKNNLNDVFSITGVVQPSELHSYYIKCDALLVVDAPAKRSIFFPSKLMEYFLYKKPILAITPKKGITYILLKEAGHYPVENGSIPTLTEKIICLINNYDTLRSFNDSFYDTFSPDIAWRIYNNNVVNKLT